MKNLAMYIIVGAPPETFELLACLLSIVYVLVIRLYLVVNESSNPLGAGMTLPTIAF